MLKDKWCVGQDDKAGLSKVGAVVLVIGLVCLVGYIAGPVLLERGYSRSDTTSLYVGWPFVGVALCFSIPLVICVCIRVHHSRLGRFLRCGRCPHRKRSSPAPDVGLGTFAAASGTGAAQIAQPVGANFVPPTATYVPPPIGDASVMQQPPAQFVHGNEGGGMVGVVPFSEQAPVNETII